MTALTFAERRAASRAAFEAEIAQAEAAAAAHRRAAQEADYREYSFTHRYDPQPASDWSPEKLAQARARRSALTHAQNEIHAAIRRDCLCADALSHING